jgi:phosphoglycolate phosphatase
MDVFRKYKIHEISMDEFRKKFELPYLKFYQKYKADITKDQIDVIFNKAIHEVGEPKPFPHVKEIVMHFHEHKKRIIVISSVPQDKLEQEARDYGIKQYINDLNGSVHDKIDIIKDILKKNFFNPEQTLYVGDLPHDIVAGKSAGVKTVAVTWGYTDKERLMDHNPDFTIEDIRELKDIIDV